MKTTLFSFLIGSAMLVACGGGGGTTATDATSTDPSGTTTAPSGTTEATVTTTEATVTTTETTGMNSMSASNETTSPPQTATTEEPVTTTLQTTETDPSGTTADETTSGTESTADTTLTDPSTTGGEPGGACVDDKDCTLLSDCCRCEAIAVGDPIPDCPMMECLLPQCDALGIDEVSCRFGTCVAEKLNCDASAILCDALPPNCPEGQLPGVTENGACWTQGCVPVDLCNVVPDCADCPNGQMCVVDELLQGNKRRCEPIPPECMGKPTCACAGQACDQDPNNSCSENDDGLLCFCPNC